MKLLIFVVSVLAGTTVYSQDRGSSCITPNGELATCIPVEQCTVIDNALATYNKSAINFAKQSQCGYDTEVLLCCGSYAVLMPKTQEIPKSMFKGRESQTPTADAPKNNILPNRTICGMDREINKVLGGTPTELDEFPWMALLRYKYEDGSDAGFKCGGTVINNRYILTAAHCIRVNPVNNFELESVRLGEWVISTKDDCTDSLANYRCADPVQDINIEEKIPHPAYRRIQGSNDVGLLRLQRNIEFSGFIRPICLPPAEFPLPPAGTMMFTSGWGSTETTLTSDVKMKVQVPLVPNIDCAGKFSRSLRSRITQNQVCAGGVRGKDACLGDSGGPLMRMYNDDISGGQWLQEGIVAWGVECGTPGVPGVYTRVAKYTNWILDNIRE